jgi:hypothetical protein
LKANQQRREAWLDGTVQTSVVVRGNLTNQPVRLAPA